MENTTLAKLERIRNRSTKYELVCRDGEKQFLAGYTRRSKQGILSMLRKNGEAWAKRISATDLITFDKRGQRATLGRFEITFSGRTQREAISNGELPWFEELPLYQQPTPEVRP